MKKTLLLLLGVCIALSLAGCNKSDDTANNTAQTGAVVEVVSPQVVNNTDGNNSVKSINGSTVDNSTLATPELPKGVRIEIKGNTTLVHFNSHHGISYSGNSNNDNQTKQIINNNSSDDNQTNSVQIVSGNNNSVVNTNSGNGTQININQHMSGSHNQNQVVIEGDDNSITDSNNSNGDATVNDKHIHTTGSIDSIVQNNGETTITITGDKHPVITQVQ